MSTFVSIMLEPNDALVDQVIARCVKPAFDPVDGAIPGLAEAVNTLFSAVLATRAGRVSSANQSLVTISCQFPYSALKSQIPSDMPTPVFCGNCDRRITPGAIVAISAACQNRAGPGFACPVQIRVMCTGCRKDMLKANIVTPLVNGVRVPLLDGQDQLELVYERGNMITPTANGGNRSCVFKMHQSANFVCAIPEHLVNGRLQHHLINNC